MFHSCPPPPPPHPSPPQPLAPHVPPYYTVVAGRLVICRPLHTVQYSNGLAFP